MKDPRYAKLAKLLVHHSAEVKAGNTVLVEAFPLETTTSPANSARAPSLMLTVASPPCPSLDWLLAPSTRSVCTCQAPRAPAWA